MKILATAAVLTAMSCGARAASCEVGAGDLSFGAYNSADAAPVDSVGTILVQCDSGGASEVAGFSIAIGPGFSGSFQPRAMQGAGDRLEYNLYVDSARSLVWGDGGGSMSVGVELNLPAERSAERLVYGRIPPGQAVAPGVYVDSLVVRIEF